jgi:hypothetical protein
MGYTMRNGEYADVLPFTPAASAARSASGESAVFEFGDRAAARLQLDVTAASGTGPTLDVEVLVSRDGVNWYSAGTFTQQVGVAKEDKLFLLDRFVKLAWTIAGTTPSFTFSVAGEVV